MKRYVLLIFVCLGWVGVATAGIVVTFEYDDGSGKMERSQSYLEGDRSRDGDSIVVGKEIITIDNGARAYWQGPPEQFCKVMNKVADTLSALLPPQYRSKPISQREITRKKIGTRSIAGFKATGYQFFEGEISRGEVWVSDDTGLSELIEGEEAMEKEMNKSPACRAMEKNSDALTDSELYKETVKGRFVLEDGSKKVVKVEKKRVPASVFSPPSGYKKFTDYAQFVNYVETHQQAGKSSPSGGAMSPSPSMPATPPPARRGTPQADEREAASTGDTDEGPGMDDLKEGIGGMLKSIW